MDMIVKNDLLDAFDASPTQKLMEVSYVRELIWAFPTKKDYEKEFQELALAFMPKNAETHPPEESDNFIGYFEGGSVRLMRYDSLEKQWYSIGNGQQYRWKAPMFYCDNPFA